MPEGKTYCKIFDVAGNFVIQLEEDRFFNFHWNGNNSNGKKCSSGNYFYLISNENEGSTKGSFVIIR